MGLFHSGLGESGVSGLFDMQEVGTEKLVISVGLCFRAGRTSCVLQFCWVFFSSQSPLYRVDGT